MTQDTRKDRRAKIVSLNVRYKSATVDEFIDNHSHDVSKGGLFIKTASPFPPGTLLKFEIRIAGDKAVIAGVGRVVWKRETTQAGPEMPAGMGVKFIKIDDASRLVIDKLVDSRGEARNAYDDGGGDAGPGPSAVPAAAGSAPGLIPRPAPPPAAPASAPTLVKEPPKPAAAAAPPTPGERGQPAPFRPAPSASKIPAALGKQTMMGLGSVHDVVSKAGAGPGPAAGRPSSDDLRAKAPPAARPAQTAPGSMARPSSVPSTNPMFPKTNSEADMPPKNEQTVMKQAAELLEEALKGAGGSMEEIGQNPLFDLAQGEALKDKGASASSTSPLATSSKPQGTPRGLGPPNEVGDEARKPASAPIAGAGSIGAEDGDEPETIANLVSPGGVAPHAHLESTVRSPTRDEPKAKPAVAADLAPKAKRSSDRPPSATATLDDEEPQKNKWLVPTLALAGAGVLAFVVYTQVYASPDSPPVPTPPPTVSAVTSAAPSASAAATASASAAASASSAPEVPSASASATADAGGATPEAAAPAVAAPPKPPVAPWRPPPKPTATATAAPPTDTDPSDNSPPATTATAKPPSTDTTTAPKPAPKPKQGKPKEDDDNPY